MKLNPTNFSFTIDLAKFLATETSAVELIEALANQYVALVSDTKYQEGSSLKQRFGDERAVQFDFEDNLTFTYLAHPNLFSFEFDGIQIRALDLVDAISVCEMRGWRCLINRQILVESLRVLESKDAESVSEQGQFLLQQVSLLNAALNDSGEVDEPQLTKQAALEKLREFGPDGREMKILAAMKENNVTSPANKQTYQTILNYFDANLLDSDNGRYFQKLKKQELICSGERNRIGCWLTEQGILAAHEILTGRVR